MQSLKNVFHRAARTKPIPEEEEDGGLHRCLKRLGQRFFEIESRTTPGDPMKFCSFFVTVHFYSIFENKFLLHLIFTSFSSIARVCAIEF